MLKRLRKTTPCPSPRSAVTRSGETITNLPDYESHDGQTIFKNNYAVVDESSGNGIEIVDPTKDVYHSWVRSEQPPEPQ